MSSPRTAHRAARAARRKGRPLRRRLRMPSIRARASVGLLAATLPLALGAQGTFAFWTDSATINTGTFTAGTLDLQVNGLDNYPGANATSSLSMSNMVPGTSSADMLTIKNAGSVPFTYTLTGALSGTDAAIFNTTKVLKLSISQNATLNQGSGNVSTCSGGTSLYSAALATTTPAPVILAKRPTPPLAATGTEALCFQITFDDTIASSNQTALQGKTATATFTASATSILPS